VGTDYGLSLTMNVQYDEYLGLMTDQPGVKVVVHSPHVNVVPENDGFVATTGIIVDYLLFV
jgi:hypothetical protein